MTAALSTQANQPLVPVQASMPVCGETKQLQPTRVAVNAQTKSVLI
jgi:hypothetical protein